MGIDGAEIKKRKDVREKKKVTVRKQAAELAEQVKQERGRQEELEEARKKAEGEKESVEQDRSAADPDNPEIVQQGGDVAAGSSPAVAVHSGIVASVVIALIIFFTGYHLFTELQARKADAEFGAAVSVVSQKMIRLAVDSEIVVAAMNKEWRDAVEQGDKDDLFPAVQESRTVYKKTIQEIETVTTELAKEIKAMPVPDRKYREYQRLKELYVLFNRYADMAISPGGSQPFYARRHSELSVEIRSALVELRMMP